jgi:hypothetical protein
VTGKITKAQVVEALQRESHLGRDDWEPVAAALVRAGLAEEPRKTGPYTYSELALEDATVVSALFGTVYWDGKQWWTPSEMALLRREPTGPKPLHHPKDGAA